MRRSKCPRCQSSNVRLSGALLSGGSISALKRRKSTGLCLACGMRFSHKSTPQIVPSGHSESLDPVGKKMMEHEFAIAADIQENLMPSRIPQIPGFELTAYYKPCLDVGGDYYDFIEIDKDHLGILVADVSGKGVPGALVMVATRAYTRSVARKTIVPREVVTRINALLHQDIPRGMFVTMFYCVLDLAANTLSCVSVGHNPMVFFRASTQSCHEVNPNGLALGIDRGPIFERALKEKQIPIKPGDRFMIYTDGLVESMNKDNELYGDERLYRRVKEFAGMESSEFVSLIVKNVEEHKGDAPQHDDITVITVRRMPLESAAVKP